MTDTGVKICGITSFEDARTAIRCGADYIGLIFVPASKRVVTLEMAKEIVTAVRSEPGVPLVVCVFQNAEWEQVQNVVETLQPDFVQCHGSESPEFCSRVMRGLGVPVVKVIEIFPDNIAEPSRLGSTMESFEQSCRTFLFDRPKHMAADDSWLEKSVGVLLQVLASPTWHRFDHRYFFAGGLTADSTGDVLSRLKPMALDVASGVESAPGRKDEAKVHAFIQAVKNSKVRRPGQGG